MIAIFLSLIDEPDDKEKFEELYYKYRQLMFSVAYKKLADKGMAEDCVQEAFLYVAKNFGRVKEVESTATKNFLATITNGYAVKKFNGESRFGYTGSDFSDDENSVCFDDFDFSQDDYSSLEISFLIDSLEDEERTFVYLHYGFGYTSAEIGDMYEKTDAYVRKRLQHARLQLKERLNKTGD